MTVKKNKKIFYCDYFILGQIVESSNPLEKLSSYTLKDNEVRIIRPKYDTSLGQFKGLYKTIGFLVVRESTGQFKGLYKTIGFLVVGGAPDEIFFHYGYDSNKSKIIYSHYRRKISSSFSGNIFNLHQSIIENGEVENNYSNLYYFLPSITDRSEEINKYLNNVSVTPVDISQNQLNTWA